MKVFATCLVVLLAIPYTAVEAAIQNYSMKTHIPVLGDHGKIYEKRHDSFGFQVEILGDDDGEKPESMKRGKPFVTAIPGERYAVRLYNPLPVRVAVNLTIDGLNSISGKPGGIANGEKWLIAPNSCITIRGWQVNGGEARRFFFTDKPKSYAKWQGDRLDRDLSVNCGVIGAAYFWSQKELDEYWEQHPIYRYSHTGDVSTMSEMRAALDSGKSSAPPVLSEAYRRAPDAEKQKAGTSMGEKESHPTTVVEFHYDTGMYKLSQAVVIYYDFAKPEPAPNPFPEFSYAPEMP